MNHIKKVYENSIAEELEVEEGDVLLSINGREIVDIMDFIYLCHDEYIEVDIQKKSGEIWSLEIDKEYDEPLGIDFVNPIIDHAKRCSNNCVFCFIDQLPKGMRETLYFKDDDSRLSFLQGNFVTLTNLKEADIDRIIEYHISPINVSVHTTDPELRKKMLGNRFAGNIMERLEKLTESGIVVNAQIVLCPGYNDGEALDKTLNDLIGFYPSLNSVAVVPIGLTSHRDGLIEMRPVDQKVALETIAIMNAFQNKVLESHETRFAFLADEFYIQAGCDFPEDESYEGYIQLEDGIGMIRKLITEVDEMLSKELSDPVVKQKVLVVTGTAASPYIQSICGKITSKYPEVQIDVKTVINEFFGHRITVVGLLTGTDIKAQLGSVDGYDRILLPESIFKSEDIVLLDDVTIDDLTDYFNVPVMKVKVDGEDLLKHILNGGSNE
jgi:putative radical SAM enzyme (TIGR03279 family)